MEETKQPTEDVDPWVISALFAEDLENERVDVPGHPGSWVEFCHLDAEGERKFVSTGQTIRFREGQGMAAEVVSDPEGQEVNLLLHTVVNFSFSRARKTKDGGTTTEATESPKAGRHTEAWIRQCTLTFKRMTPALRRWMVNEAKRVNGMREVDLGNLLGSSAS
jgi:hypothetical protein